jgi:hypothetical protein
VAVDLHGRAVHSRRVVPDGRGLQRRADDRPEQPGDGEGGITAQPHLIPVQGRLDRARAFAGPEAEGPAVVRGRQPVARRVLDVDGRSRPLAAEFEDEIGLARNRRFAG